MASTVLPQALYMFPRNPTQIHLKTLGFCSSVSCYLSAFNSTRVSISRISPNTPIVQKLSHKSFIIRAESNSEAEPENIEESEAVVDSEAPEAVPELESEVAKPPRKPRVKLGDIMGILNKRAVEECEKERPIPDIRTGDVVEIKLEVPENRRRLSVYKGIVISKQNAGIHTTIRIRRIIAGIGVEIVFPVKGMRPDMSPIFFPHAGTHQTSKS